MSFIQWRTWMSQIEESRQHWDSGRLEVRRPRQQLWKYANIHGLVGPPVQTPKLETQRYPLGPCCKNQETRRAHGFCLGEAASCSKAEGEVRVTPTSEEKKGEKMAAYSFHPRETAGRQMFSRSDSCPSGWGAKTSQWASPRKYPCRWTRCFLPGPCSGVTILNWEPCHWFFECWKW